MHNHSNAIPSDLVRDLDRQLTHLGAVAHVSVDCTASPTPTLVGIARGFLAPLPLNHSRIDTFLEAELIAARLNALQGITDRQRMVILQCMSIAGVTG
jgi:hypothetical protein